MRFRIGLGSQTANVSRIMVRAATAPTDKAISMGPWFEIMKRHGQKILPALDGEGFEDDRGRMTRLLTPSQRAILAAEARAKSREAYDDRLKRRRV